jgi:hypothetical protein
MYPVVTVTISIANVVVDLLTHASIRAVRYG